MIPDIHRRSRMEATDAITTLDAVRLSDWIDANGISRSTAYELLKLLGIEPEARRVPTSRKPVSHLTSEQVQVLEPWAAELRRGATLPQLRDRLGQIQTIQDDDPGPSEIVPANDPGLSQIIPALAAALQQPSDPLRRARALAEAADLGVPLSNVELAEVVGIAPRTINKWVDGHSPRPGFILRRQKISGAVWWTVERPGLSGTVPKISGITSAPRSVGFAQVLDVQAITLPRW
jgi:hypothetical protein